MELPTSKSRRWRIFWRVSRDARCIAAAKTAALRLCDAHLTFGANSLEAVNEEETMTWATPTLNEICIGLEINGYLPAEF
jgi:coenzyme PQQ precursor peptide PqqA